MSIPNPVARRYRALLDRPTTLVKQAPTAVVLVVGVVLVATVPSIATVRLPEAVSGVCVVAAATLLAVCLTVRGKDDSALALVVPMADIVGLGLFRAGTGGFASLFGAFVLLPVVWIAAAPGIRHVFVVAGLTSLALLVPYFSDPPANSVEWLRGVIAPVTYAIVAAIVNELSRLQRSRAALAEELAAQRSVALAEKDEKVWQLRESELRYRELLAMFESVWNATTSQAVISTDLDGDVQGWNPGAEQLFAVSAQEATDGMLVSAIFPTSTVSVLDAEADAPAGGETSADPMGPGVRMLLGLAGDGVPVDRTLDLVTGDGQVFPARLTVTPRTDSAGRGLGYLLVVSDETRAAEAARAKDEFVGMVSHELRTPLSSILGYVDLLQDDPAQPLTEEQQQLLDVVDRNARRLLTLVGDLLLSAQVSSGHLRLDLREVDVVPVVSDALESAAPRAGEAGVTLTGHMPAGPVRVMADPVRLTQAIDNLVSNAIKFTPQGGHVDVAVADEEDRLTITVCDTGIGIPPDEIDQLFTRFYRSSTATRNAVPGIGLGLAITRAIVEAHGGTIDVTSELGTGTELRMTFPHARTPVAHQSATGGEGEARATAPRTAR